MSRLLRLASCTAFSPARAALRGGSAARSTPGTPPLALVLSSGVHFAVLALFLAAAARSNFEEPPQVEIRLWPREGTTILTPPPVSPPHTVGGRVKTGDGTIQPVPPEDPFLADVDLPPFGPMGPAGGIRPDAPVATGGGGQRLPPPADLPAASPETPTAYDEPPVPVVAPEPPYSDLARDAGIEGRVVLEALVSWEGHVREVRVREGNPTLAGPAVSTVKSWRFRPARWRGRAVTTWVPIPIVFRLQ